MNGLKLLWLEPQVQFQGKGIITAWGEEMARKGWIIERDPGQWESCDLVFFGSDSMLREDLLGQKPTICYFWGWMPARMLNRDFQQWVMGQLRLLWKCTRILTPGPLVMDQLANFGLPSEICLPGVDARLLSSPPARRENRVMFISRLAPQKRLDLVIVALSLIKPRPLLIACGPGDYDPYIELAQSYNVEMKIGGLTDAEKVVELHRSIALVHPSSYEGFGLGPLEALFCGTPAIVFDIPQMRWLLQEDAYYFSSVEGLAQTIVEIINNPTPALERAALGGRRVASNFTLEIACDRLWAHIHQTIKEHLAHELRERPGEWDRIYDDEHRRNWAYSLDRFDPTWERHWRAQAFIEALKECKAERVLDVGCGAVYPTILARAGFFVTAADISPEAIKQVSEIARKWGVRDKIFPVVEDAQALSLEPDTFDAVIQGELWEHVPDVEKVINEGIRVLKPGGYLIATSPIGAHHYDPMHLRTFEESEINDLVNRAKQKHKITLKRLEKIAEQGTDPSCFLIVLEKLL